MAKDKSPFELSVDTVEVESILRNTAPGDIATYEILSESIGRNIRTEAAYCLASARRRLMRDESMVFATVRGVGVKRLRKTDVVIGVLPETTHRVRGLIRRQAKKLATVEGDYADLGKEQKVAFNTARAFLGTLKEISKETSMKKIERHTANADKALPLAATLDAFKK